jgi:hypothetical protein
MVEVDSRMTIMNAESVRTQLNKPIHSVKTR